MKRKIEPFKHSSEIFNSLKSGILITTKFDNKVNSMTISWGTLGIEWNKKIFTIFIRENRFTKFQLDNNPEFTVNIPYGDFDKNILKFCGIKSGYNTDKIKELGLTLEDSNTISVPAIKELPLTLECKVIYRQEQDKGSISKEDKIAFYPEDIESSYHGSNRDYHTAYYGEILDAYIIE
ncbi:Flavin reductase like domain-containing protein [Anaerosphaera aminiphila DSM 21120]|uniref:Flavin reductase like domain-containing protein n=1 Tax=Anaerosphaera aminiphila DSM 21120 TaxID=1120995 RepID=A0A1M5NTD3_9FIRM|nr:flavin reductase family protein [Anaerosphaera aminiphila]SHG92213.1 Flavin reductase like domain-containing protein [Anaerosphaera aminiphila DSM 21120]